MINSNTIKASLLSYYRFKRGYICVDECQCTSYEISDILVDTGKAILDIEIKISKSDLIRGEARKKKHEYYKKVEKFPYAGKRRHPNKFFICVPENLKEVAIQWVEETNKNYGIIIYTPPKEFRYQRLDFEYNLQFIKHAKSFNSCYDKEYFQEVIAKRLTSAYINNKQKAIIKAAFEKKQKANHE